MKTAVKELNFLPLDILQERENAERRRKLAPIIAAGILAALAAFLTLPLMTFYYQKQIAAYQAEYTRLQAANTYYEQRVQLDKEYNEKLTAINTLEAKNKDITKLIDEIAGIVPDGVVVTKLGIQSDGGVILTFETDSAYETAQFIVGLRSLDIFKEVEPKQVPLRGFMQEVQMELPFKDATRKLMVERPAADKAAEDKTAAIAKLPLVPSSIAKGLQAVQQGVQPNAGSN